MCQSTIDLSHIIIPISYTLSSVSSSTLSLLPVMMATADGLFLYKLKSVTNCLL